MRVKQHLAAAAVSAGLFVPFSAHATNGYQLIGVGSLQKGVAGAVTAMPESAMTAITNPAGMARIGNRTDFSMEAFLPEPTMDFTGSFGEKADSAVSMYGIPALGWTAPVSDEHSNVYFGGGIYGTSGLGVDYGSTLMAPAAASPFGADTYYEGYSSISFWQMAPTLAWNSSDRLSLGVSLNIDYQAVAFMQRFQLDTDATPGPDTTAVNFDLSRGAQAFGYGLTFGALFDVNDKLTLGATYKSKQYFPDLEYQLGYGDIQNIQTSNCPGVCPAGTYKMDLDYPQQLAAGLAYRVTSAVTVSADVKWIDWSSTMSEIKISGPSGTRVTMPAGWSDQTVYAIGVKWAASPRVNLRAGYNYAKSPIDEKDVDNNYILPGIVESHYTIGGDYALNKYWDLAFHYMYAPEVTLKSPTTNAEIGLSEQSVGINIGYKF